jgi:hypothetical protein
MKKIIAICTLTIMMHSMNAQIIDLKKIDLSKLDISGLLNKVMNVKQGWAPKFSFGNINIDKVSKVAQIINLKNINTATKLFNTFKTGRTIYKTGAYVGMATSAYGLIKNIAESNKTAATAQLQQLKDDAIKKAQNFAVGGGLTILSGVLVKLLTKKAASKAADAFNGIVKKKLTDILSLDTPTTNSYVQTGIALKIKL